MLPRGASGREGKNNIVLATRVRLIGERYSNNRHTVRGSASVPQQIKSISLRRNSDQVNMVGHQAISDEYYSVEIHILVQELEVDRSIGITVQDEAPPVPRCVTWCGTSTATTRLNRPMTGTITAATSPC